ncbi:MAG: thioredoxin family protein [Acidobacteria bacterium]|nr:thioredoxin family protein [Acidobacteriota bacterium]
MRRRLVLPALAVLMSVVPSRGEKLDPIHWTLESESMRAAAGGEVLLRLTAKMDPGWHLYSLATPEGGPLATRVGIVENAAVRGCRLYARAPQRTFDKNFNIQVETYEDTATFLFSCQLKPDALQGRFELAAEVRYQTCNDKMCLPPVKKKATASLLIDPGARPAKVTVPAEFVEFRSGSGTPKTTAPVETKGGEAQSPAMFLLIAFGFGLAAIFTPCVFPMIPITVSFFLGRETVSRRASIAQAAVFSLGIVVLFSSLGLAATLILGPFGVVQLGSSPWVNGFIALVFLAFALSLLGAFEIALPSSLLTRMDRVSGRGGILGALLMGLTFSLTSFACVGPLVGTLLAASVSHGGWQPLAGMVAFAVGLAAPFFLLALFPSYLRRLPRSGGWMSQIKVVLAFVILAAMLKYASNVDQVMQWGWLTRERFLAGWVVLFTLPGAYLLGWLRLEGVKADEHIGVARLVVGSLFLAFALSLIPGMTGARLGEIEAYIPAPAVNSQTKGNGATLVWMKNQYAEALAKAREENKLVLVNFTGYACTNCHWMKANMFTRPEIQQELNKYILVELYTDGTDEVSRRNQDFEQNRFGTVALPFYAIVGGDEQVVATFAGLTRDPAEFLAFLKR